MMYRAHFGLIHPPFNNTPDPAFYYSTPDHEEAIATLQYATHHRKGFVLITGEIGAGKTLIGRIFLRQIEGECDTAVITDTRLGHNQLLAAICRELSIEVSQNAGHLELMERLQTHLLEQYARDRSVVVLVDEAQTLPDESFETLRMLGNLEADDAKLLQVCILGQPELRRRFGQPKLKQLDQRLFRRFHLDALNRDQTGEYIRHRLSVAGLAGGDLFTPEAMDLIHAASEGIPRVINQICDNALLTAYGEHRDVVDVSVIERVLDQEADHRAISHRSPVDEALAIVEQPAGITPTKCEAASPDEAPEPPEPATATDLGAPSAGPPEGSDAPAPTDRPSAAPRRADVQDRETTPTDDEARSDVSRLHQMLRQITEQRDTVQVRLDGYREELQTMIEEIMSRTSSTERQLDALARSHAGREEIEVFRSRQEERITQVLDEVQRQRHEFSRMLEQLQVEWSATRDQAVAMSQTSIAPEALDQLAERLGRQENDVRALSRNITSQMSVLRGSVRDLLEHAAAVPELLESRDDHDQKLQALQEAGEEHGRTLSALDASVRRGETAMVELDGRIEALREQVQTRLETVGETLRDIEGRSASTDDLARLRQAHTEALTEINARINEESRAIEKLRASIESASAGLAADQQQHVNALNHRLSEQADQLDQLRREWVEHHASLNQRILELGREQDARHEALLGRLDQHRRAVQELVDGVLGRCQAAEQQLEALAGSGVDRADMEAWQRDQVDQAARMRADLEKHRQTLHEGFGELMAQYQATRSQLESLTAEKASAADLQDVRTQTGDIQNALEQLEAKRARIETVVEAINARCEEASRRLDEESSRHQRDVEDLNRRWQALMSSVESLAATTTPLSRFEEREQAVSDGLESLGRRVDEVREDQSFTLRTIVDKMQEMARKLEQLESRKAPEPVQFRLTPSETAELARLLDAASAERRTLQGERERAGDVAAQLRQASSEIHEVMQEWSRNADDVRRRSDELRHSAQTSTRLIRVMKRYHQALDAKLKSERWQNELERGEALTRRLEQALGDARTMHQQLLAARSDAEDEAAGWSRRHEQAKALSDRLGELIGNAESTTGQFHKMLAGIARNAAGISQAIAAARRTDEQERPSVTRMTNRQHNGSAEKAHRSEGKPEQPVVWPALKTRTYQPQAS